MTRNCHVPFCRAVGEATLLLTLIILKKGLSTVGHAETPLTPPVSGGGKGGERCPLVNVGYVLSD